MRHLPDQHHGFAPILKRFKSNWENPFRLATSCCGNNVCIHFQPCCLMNTLLAWFKTMRTTWTNRLNSIDRIHIDWLNLEHLTCQNNFVCSCGYVFSTVLKTQLNIWISDKEKLIPCLRVLECMIKCSYTWMLPKDFHFMDILYDIFMIHINSLNKAYPRVLCWTCSWSDQHKYLSDNCHLSKEFYLVIVHTKHA